MTLKRVLQVSGATALGLGLVLWLRHASAPWIPATALNPWIRLNALLSAWFLQLWGVPVWADHTILRTDLYAYPIAAGYHATGVALGALGLAAGLSYWRRYRPIEWLFMLTAAMAASLCWNVLRITLLLHLGPAPLSVAITSLQHDTERILAVLVLVQVWLHLILVESARFIRQQRLEPLPGATSGALSEMPPFWHRVLRRYRPTHVLLPTIAIVAAIAYAGRPTRRHEILRTLVTNMRSQQSYDHALRLGHRLAAQRPNDTDWRLHLVRIMLLAGYADQALLELEALRPLVAGADMLQINLLQTHAYLHKQDWPSARRARDLLESQAGKDPIWNMILLELALALGDQQKVLALAPAASQAFTQTSRITPALPVVQSSGRGDILRKATGGISWNRLSLPVFLHQILSLLHANDQSAAAEQTQFAIQRWPGHPDLLLPAMLLTHLNPTEWEPRLARLSQDIVRTTADPDTLLAVMQAAFALQRPDLAWQAYRHLQSSPSHALHARLALALHAQHWFSCRSQYLHVPGAAADATTDLLPLAVLARHIPFFQTTLARIPHAAEIPLIIADLPGWQSSLRDALITQLGHDPSVLQDNPLLQQQYALLCEVSGKPQMAFLQYQQLARQHPDWAPFATFSMVRLEQEDGNISQAYARVRDLVCAAPALAEEEMLPWEKHWPPSELPLQPQTAYQRPLLVSLIDLLWTRHHPLTALFTSREALRRFPNDPVLRTLAADILLQVQQPEQALHLLENTLIRRTPLTNTLEAEALQATQRLSVLPTFRRQQRLPPETTTSATMPTERLPPAERLFAPIVPEEITLLPPHPDDPVYPLFQQALSSPDLSPALTNWINAAATRLEQAEALHRLSLLLHAAQNPALAGQAARLALIANPQEPNLWKLLLRGATDAGAVLATARRFCPSDPDLWLAELVWTMQTTDNPAARNALLQDLLQEARSNKDFPVDTLVRAADFLWRGTYYAAASELVERFHGRERGLLPAHLLGMTAAEHNGDRGRALYHIEAAVEAAGAAAPELHARFIKSKLLAGQTAPDGIIINALRQLQTAEPGNLFWTELLGYMRYQRGGSDRQEGGWDMQQAIAAGSTNRLAFLIAAEGLRRMRRTRDAAAILQQGLELYPQDPVMINNLAYTLAENADTAAEAMDWIMPMMSLAGNSAEIRDTLAFMLLRNNDLETARQLLTRNLHEVAPDSRIWFRSQMHLAEIAWRQDRTGIAISMLEQLLRGARNISDEDVLAANRLLLRIRMVP